MHEIDIAGHRLGIPDRHLPQQKRTAGIGLNGLQRVAHPARQCVDLVDEEEMRNGPILQQLHQRAQGRRSLGRGLAHDDRKIDSCERARCLIGELD
jgi:hypothetical protein